MPPVCNFPVSVCLFLKMRQHFYDAYWNGNASNWEESGTYLMPSLNHITFKENTSLGIDIIFLGSKDDWCTSRIHRLWWGRIFNKEIERVPQCCSAAWRGQRALSFTFLAFLIRNGMIQVSGIWQKLLWVISCVFFHELIDWFPPWFFHACLATFVFVAKEQKWRHFSNWYTFSRLTKLIRMC